MGGVAIVKGKTLEVEEFADKIFLKDVFSSANSDFMSAGLFRLEAGACEEIPYNYDEILYIIRGSLEILYQGKTYVGNAGDFMYVKKGSTIRMGAKEKMEGIYVTYPHWVEASS